MSCHQPVVHCLSTLRVVSLLLFAATFPPHAAADLLLPAVASTGDLESSSSSFAMSSGSSSSMVRLLTFDRSRTRTTGLGQRPDNAAFAFLHSLLCFDHSFFLGIFHVLTSCSKKRWIHGPASTRQSYMGGGWGEGGVGMLTAHPYSHTAETLLRYAHNTSD